METDFKKIIASIPNLTPEDRAVIENSILIKEFDKGTVLLKEGQLSKNCYFVVEGCVRQYIIKNGEEKTTAFYTEGNPVNSFTSYSKQKPAEHYLVCSENCKLTVGNPEDEQKMYAKYPALKVFVTKEEASLTGDMQDELFNFMTSTPEERYKNLLEQKPNLLQRVPQHQLASYIGVTPESLSRIRKRISASNS